MKDKLLFSALFFVFFFVVPPVYAQSAIIVDHRHTDITKVPVYWIDKAKKDFNVVFWHTSHGSQLFSGMDIIKTQYGNLFDYFNDLYYYRFGPSGNPKAQPGQLSIWNMDGTDLGNPDRTSWVSTTEKALTNSANEYAVFPNMRNLVIWSWCGQVSTATDTDIQTLYLNNMSNLEHKYPNVTFVYMTGHLDGTDTANTPGTLKYNNKLVRDYAIANGKVLFDFADIESYSPDGTYYPTTTDACAWCTTWCSSHPNDCTGLTSSCAHSHPFNCKLKAKAFWYMMARLAGWDGGSGGVTPTLTPRPTVTPTPTPSCSQKSHGDADCNGTINILDFEIWRREFLGIDTTAKADFDSSGGVTILDFEIWRRGFLGL